VKSPKQLLAFSQNGTLTVQVCTYVGVTMVGWMFYGNTILSHFKAISCCLLFCCLLTSNLSFVDRNCPMCSHGLV